MAWPEVPLRSYVNGSTPPIDAHDLNAMQVATNQAWAAPYGRAWGHYEQEFVTPTTDVDSSSLPAVFLDFLMAAIVNSNVALGVTNVDGNSDLQFGIMQVKQTGSGTTAEIAAAQMGF